MFDLPQRYYHIPLMAGQEATAWAWVAKVYGKNKETMVLRADSPMDAIERVYKIRTWLLTEGYTEYNIVQERLPIQVVL